MESCVTGVIAPIDLPDILLQTVQNHILQGRREGGEGGGASKSNRHGVSCSAAHANADKCNRGYLIAQPRGSLQQGLPGVLVDDQPPDLWGDGLFGWRLRIAASSRRASLTGEG